MSKKLSGSWMAKTTLAVILAGIVGCGTGCEATEGMLLVARTSATNAATQAVGELVGGAVEGIFGSLVGNVTGG